ncbi:unnamed protein product, partial [Rotaria sp. Silwood1]
MSDDDNDDGGD